LGSNRKTEFRKQNSGVRIEKISLSQNDRNRVIRICYIKRRPEFPEPLAILTSEFCFLFSRKSPEKRQSPGVFTTFQLTCYDKGRIKISNPPMSLEFGHHFFRNRRGFASASLPGLADDNPVHSLGELNERVIILRKEDICADTPGAPVLDWFAVEKGEIAVQLKDTEGLGEGSVTIKASILQRLHPALLPIQLEGEYLFPISLKTVVLQVQPHLRQEVEERPEQIGADFDTPIAQVAREDEGFFKLWKIAEPTETPIDRPASVKQTTPGPILTPADRPPSAARKRPGAGSNHLGASPSSSPATPPSVPPQSPESEEKWVERPLLSFERHAQNQNPRKRIGEERLREIFMTEDLLNPDQVANLVAALPKVTSAMIMLTDGTILGGNVPDGYHLETAQRAPLIMRSVQEFNQKLRSQETSAFTMLGDIPVTLFAEGNVYLLISHQGRGLLPGVRQRIGEIARALDAVVS
jgi:hypothetical protein